VRKMGDKTAEASQADTNAAVAHFDCGNAHLRKDGFDRTILDYTKAIRLNPNDADARNNRRGIRSRSRKIRDGKRQTEIVCGVMYKERDGW